MLKKILIMFPLFLCYTVFAAGPYTHILLADLYLQTVYSDQVSSKVKVSQKQQYLMGSIFPDIRYMEVIKREQSHSTNNDYQRMSLKSGFLGGMHHHSFIDQHRERFAEVYGIYEHLSDISKSDRATFLKLIEDEIFFRQTKHKYRAAHTVPITSIQHFKISQNDIKKWYEIIDRYLILGPSKFIKLMAEKNLGYFNIKPDKLSEWSKKIGLYTSNPIFTTYCDKLLSSFQEHFIFVYEDKGKLFNEAKFRKWLKKFTDRVVSAGVNRELVEHELEFVLFSPRVLYKDRNQKNNTRDINQELISEWLSIPEHGPGSTRITVGREMLKKYEKYLISLEEKLNIDKEIIIAIWGTESKFGYVNYQYEALDAALTLAYDGRRSFFEKEAIILLKQISEKRITRPQPSSWAAAIGQAQFLPSNVAKYGMSYNNKKAIDLMHSIPDTLASIASFLHAHGYKKNLLLGQLVSVKDNSNNVIKKHDTLDNFKNYLDPSIGKWLIGGYQPVRLISLSNDNLPKLLVTENYDVLMKWNKSDLFGMQILYLSSELALEHNQYGVTGSIKKNNNKVDFHKKLIA